MLDNTAETTTGLDAIQLAALRKANRVCFYHRATPDATGLRSYIAAIKTTDRTKLNPFEGEQSLCFAVDFRLREYTTGDDKIPYNGDAWEAFEMIHSAQATEEWRTIVSLLRVGDKLTLLWQRGGWTTEAMQNASPKFYGDSLSLIVERAKATLQFHIDQQISENNTARMIRKGV
jgi:hypothetical protein